MNTVLYYPFLHPSPAWLRVAALCWDKVYRIRPSDAPDDPDEIATLNSVCHNILESITPGDAGGLPPGNYARSLDEVRAAVRLKLERWVTDNLEDLRHQQPSPEDGRAIADHVGLLASKFPDVEVLSLLHRHGLARSRVVSVEGTETDWLTWDLEGTTQHFNRIPMFPLWVSNRPEPLSTDGEYERFCDLRARGYAMKNAGQISEGKALIKEAVAIRERNRIRAPYLRREILVPSGLAAHYLSLLATEAAQDLNCDVVADRLAYVDTALHDVRVVRGEVMTSVLEAHVPSGLDTLPPDRIAELRAELAAGRLRYQRDVQGIVQEFAGVASEGQLGAIKQRIVAIATERVNDVKQTYRRARLDTIVKAIGVSVAPPAVAASIASALGIGIFAPAGVVAALAVVSAARLLELEKTKAEKAKSAWSYVLDVGGVATST